MAAPGTYIQNTYRDVRIETGEVMAKVNYRFGGPVVAKYLSSVLISPKRKASAFKPRPRPGTSPDRMIRPSRKNPPSTGIAVPVTKSEAGEARNTRDPREIADLAPARRRRSRQHAFMQPGHLLARAVVRSVSIQPGRMALTWMLSGAQAQAQAR